MAIAALAGAIAISGALVGCTSQSASELAGLRHSHVTDSHALEVCAGALGGSADIKRDIASALDSTVADAKSLSSAAGLDINNDTNLRHASQQDYAAICVLDLPSPGNGRPAAHGAMYVLEHHRGSNWIIRWPN